jgi:hypothetical protein
MTDMGNGTDQSPEEDEYDRLALLEDLESLLEEIEEQGVVEVDQPGPIPADVLARMNTAGVRDVQQLRDRIRGLHAELDDDDRDFTITES